MPTISNEDGKTVLMHLLDDRVQPDEAIKTLFGSVQAENLSFDKYELYVPIGKKIENLIWKHDIKKGYAIVITNNPGMWSEGRGASREFSLNQPLRRKLQWHGSNIKKRKPIILRCDYAMDWRDYSNPDSHQFRYMALEISKPQS